MSESPDVEEVSKPQKQGLLSGWVTNAPSTTTTITAPKPKQGIDLDKWKSSAAAQRKNLDAASDSSLKKAISAASPTAEMLKAKGGLPARGSLGPATKRAAQNAQMDANEFRRKRMEEQEAMRKRNLAIIAAQKGGAVGAGSGVQGLGVAGKDHSTKGQGVMVSSDEESSEDEEGGLDAELFGGKQLKRSSDVRNKAAGAVGLKPEVKKGPVKLQRQVRSAKDMRARLAPDLTPLHKAILSWDFFHEGDFPPNSNEYQYKGVSNSFRHVGEYQGTFQPLLLLEAWQGFVKNREENTFKPYEIKIVNRSSVDAFIELSSSMAHADNREVQLSEGDIILVSKAQQPTADPKAPHCLARVYRIRRQKQHLEILYRVAPASSMMSSLTPGSLIYGTKIQSITPLERDQAIPLLDYTEKQLQPLISNYTVNRAQAKAVKSAIDNDAFTLIQGPPGSGKTKTIVAIVGALLSDSLVDKQVGVRIEAPKPNGGFGSAQGPASKKLLVCAPSNAAVDELVMRFKDGIKTLKGVHKKVNVVRLGRSDAINTNVVDVTMDELVNQKLGQTNGDNDARQKTQQIMKEHQGVSEQLRLARAQLDAGEAKGEELSKLQEDFQLLKKRKAQLGTQIDNAKDAENAASRNAELNRKRVQQAVLDEAHIICATLSGSGHEMFQGLNIEFETVVVDEAAQCVEMSALIPLKYGCAKCILVGDPKQLPPTVFSKEAARFQYEQSLFVRMQSNFPDAVHLLDTQYRMHPDISAFPSATFYDGRLLDGDDMAGLRKRPWHSSSLLAPYRFFDVRGQHQAAPKGHSLINLAEIEVAIALYERLVKDYNSFDFSSKVGIITPYKSQLRELKERFARHFGNTIIEKVEFNTTDAFQGRESEVIIFSCVRASPAGGIGFLQDIRRMNVGLTRAKSSLWVLGNSESLMRGEYWKKLVVDAKDRGTYTTGDLMSMLRQHSSNFPAKPSNVVKKSAKSVQNGFSSDNAVSDGRAASISSTGSGRSTPVYQDPTARVKEEIRVKEEARIKDEERSSPIPMEGRSSVPPKIDVDEQDVEMEDAYSESRSGTLTLQNGLVKPETGEAKPATAPKTQDATRPRASMPAKPAQPAIMRKRKPADPFMPKKQQKRA
ncbi:DEAD-box type RNA helicase [Taxawa tesnikishii (nom. ined.)]|nr:DEAD-box type RNA helicase [Dothideales sp. JES 119]